MDFWLNISFLLIILIQDIAHCRASKVTRTRKMLNHNHPNCFTNDTKYEAAKINNKYIKLVVPGFHYIATVS